MSQMNHRPKGHFRSSPRPQIASKVSINKQGAPPEEATVAYTRDIGMGGLFVETDESLAMGDLLEVSLATPSKWEPLIVIVSVCRIEKRNGDDPGGVGLRFLELTESQTVALGELTASLDFEE